MLFSSKITILLDTEYTAWEGSKDRKWLGENEYREIVQIAAIKIDSYTLEESDYFSVFIKPFINPLLSDYFIKLTGITQKIVDEQGSSYTEALNLYTVWCEQFDTYSFGFDDGVLRENCALFGINFPIMNKFFDIRNIFLDHGIPADKYTSGTIVEAFGKKIERSAHNALNDVRTTLEGLRLLSQKQT